MRVVVVDVNSTMACAISRGQRDSCVDLNPALGKLLFYLVAFFAPHPKAGRSFDRDGPHRRGVETTYEDETIANPKGREIHFGQDVKVYGADFVRRRTDAEFDLKCHTAFRNEAINFGLFMGRDLNPCFTPLEGPKSNDGMSEAFVKTFKVRLYLDQSASRRPNRARQQNI
jgi:hypothetical protein